MQRTSIRWKNWQNPFSLRTPQNFTSADALEQMEEITGSLLPAIIASCPKEAYSLAEITLFAALSETAWNQDISREHMEDLLRRGSSILSTLKGLDWTCTVFISHGMYHLPFQKVPYQSI